MSDTFSGAMGVLDPTCVDEAIDWLRKHFQPPAAQGLRAVHQAIENARRSGRHDHFAIARGCSMVPQ